MSKLDIKKMTNEEIENFDYSTLSPNELNDVLIQLDIEANVFKTKEQANKLVLNSIYGAMANRFSYFYDKRLAEAITIQGQDAIKYSEKVINHYFKNVFHKDKFILDLLQKECSTINMNPTPVKNDPVVYIDTDSCYVTFEEIAKNIDWKGDANTLVLILDKHRLQDFFKKSFEKYAKGYNTDNYLDFELESISRSGIFVQKKKYIQDISWQDGKIYDENTYIKTTGLEIIRSNTPSFCRKELVDLVKWIFVQENGFSEKDLTLKLLEIKKRFAIADTEHICFNTSIGDYEKYVKDDKNAVVINDGCGAHIRGAALHNFAVNSNEKYKTMYDHIKTGDKVLWYYNNNLDERYNVFSFKRGYFPKEFAPNINIDLMFEKSIINPLNNIIKSIDGITEIQGSLKIKRKLF